MDRPLDSDVDDELSRALRAMRDQRPLAPDPRLAQRVQRLAGAALKERGRAAPLLRVCARAALTTALAVTVIGYLSWAVDAASALCR